MHIMQTCKQLYLLEGYSQILTWKYSSIYIIVKLLTRGDLVYIVSLIGPTFQAGIGPSFSCVLGGYGVENIFSAQVSVHICISHNSPAFCLPDEGLWDILIKDIPKEVTSYTFSMDILKQGVSYDFRVIAVNDYGYGTPSAPSPSVSGNMV